jgi:hypothetical protein
MVVIILYTCLCCTGYTLGSNEIIGTPPTPGGSLRSNSFSPFARASSHDQQQHGGVLTGGYVDDLGLLDDTPLATIAEQREDQLFSESLNHSQFGYTVLDLIGRLVYRYVGTCANSGYR